MKPISSLATLLAAGAVAVSLTTDPPAKRDAQAYAGWETYGGHPDATRYSSLSQINTGNVKNLQVAWTYRTGEIDTTNKSQIQCQPIVVDGVVYATSSRLNVLAIDGATGREVWRTNLSKAWSGPNSWAGTNRGVTYWADGTDRRIFVAAGNFLFCLNAADGQPVTSFGEGGRIDLQKDHDYHKEQFFLVANTPGIVYKDLYITGMRLSEGLDAAPGHIRAFDVRTGKRRWIFHTIPHPGEPGFETWKDKTAYKKIGGANNWAGMSLDEKRGIVYVPTGSATYDFWGGYRKGDNLYANCLLALDAATGKKLWHFQAVHHDVWDRDFPANPTLATIRKDGKTIDAVAQISKQGMVYLFDRVTGKPVFPIKETPVPSVSTVPGEELAKTQPIPTLPEPFMRMSFTEKDIIDITPEHHAEILGKFREMDPHHLFAPPSQRGIVLFPGMDGGGEWGGAAYDPETNLLYVNANEMPWAIKMVPNPTLTATGPHAKAQTLYASNCANCHGLDRKGNGGAFPNLTLLKGKRTPDEVGTVLKQGKGAMPAFAHLSDADRQALVAYLLDLKSTEPTRVAGGSNRAEATPSVPTKGVEKKEVEGEAPLKAPYVMTGYMRFVTKDGYPAIKPPWGTLTAINLATGKRAWQVPLGDFPELTKKGIPKTGTENYGGPAVTAGGLVFIGASRDEKMHAFDKRTGELLWEMPLPAGGYATPAVYQAGGKQFVVIACGGGKMGTKSGDSYVAFALP
jgi:quinoprotein glucose dehydrogenase